MSEVKAQTHYRTCNLCEAMCGLEIQYQGKEVLSIKGDSQDPFSRGHICPKALALKDIYEDPDRLKFPVKKTDQGWEQISWEEAFDEVADRLFEIQQKYEDNNAVAIYQGNPNAHNLGTMLVGPNFTRSLKTKNRFSATSVDQLPHHFASFYMLGHQLLLPVPDIDRTDFLLMLGANPLASNGSLMTAPDIGKRLRAIQERDGKVVVIDPRLSETAEKASAHYFINPGQDVYFLLAFVYVIFEEKLEKLGRLEAFTQGVEDLREVSKDFSPEKVADVIGISAEEIRKLVREFCAAPRAVCYGRMGVSTQIFGSACNWLIYGINILTGNFDEPGGAMFTLPAVDVVGVTGMRGSTGSHGRWKSRVRGLPEFGGEIPASALAEEILTPGDGQIKALVTIAGNPVLSTPNGQQLEKALEALEFMVSIDIYITETSKHADIILPPQTGLEVPHYDVIFHYLAIRNTSKFSPPLFEPEKGSKADWEIFRALSERILAKRGQNGHSGKKPSDPTKRFNPENIVNLALRFGPYGSKGSKMYGLKPFGEPKEGLKMHHLYKAPHGLDLGPLQPCLPQRLFTQDKKIVLNADVFLKDVERIKSKLDDLIQNKQNGAYWLIGRRHLRSNNSWMHNSLRLVKGPNRCTLIIHPEDAQALNLENGEMAEVSSRVGSIQIVAEVSEKIKPGVVSIPHGWGHHRKKTRWKIAEQYAGVSMNDLTDDQLLDTLSGNAALNGIPVQIKKAEN